MPTLKLFIFHRYRRSSRIGIVCQQLILSCLVFLFSTLPIVAVEHEGLLTKVEKMNHCTTDDDCVRTRWEIRRGQLCPTQCGTEGLLVHRSELTKFKQLVPATGLPKGCDHLYACNPLPAEVFANLPVPGCVKEKCQLVPKRK
jgi:hypothetical protein